MGYEFVDKDSDKIITIKTPYSILRYELLNVLEFTSSRKRMSVIVKEMQTNKLWLLTKGADSVMAELLQADQEKSLDSIMQFLNDYAVEGLRTLLLAKRELD